jgi:hypothetical protein
MAMVNPSQPHVRQLVLESDVNDVGSRLEWIHVYGNPRDQ